MNHCHGNFLERHPRFSPHGTKKKSVDISHKLARAKQSLSFVQTENLAYPFTEQLDGKKPQRLNTIG
jgi:hypothetical protein